MSSKRSSPTPTSSLNLTSSPPKRPVGAHAVDQLGGADQPEPQLRLVALDLARRPVDQRRPLGTFALPAPVLGPEARLIGRRVHARRQVVAHGGAVDDRVQPAGGDQPVHGVLEVVEGFVAVLRPAPGGERPAVEAGGGLGVGGEQGDGVAAVMGGEGDGGAGAAGEDVGEAADAVDGYQGVAGGDEQVHGTPRSGREALPSFYGGAPWRVSARRAAPCARRTPGG
jgi:hypothetical protein